MIRTFVVLVRAEYSRNLGACARAAANMGVHRLILIDPQCEIDEPAREAAAGAQEFLKSLTSYRSWREFYESEGEGFRLALTRRPGKRRKIQSLKDALSDMPIPRSDHDFNVYLIFGPEADGLNADDLAWTNRSCYLPTYGDFKSLNLAQAVLLACYIFQERYQSEFGPTENLQQASCTRKRPVFFPESTIKNWITAMGFDIQKRKSSAFVTLRRLLLHNWPTNQELHVLESVFQQSIRKMQQREQSPTSSS